MYFYIFLNIVCLCGDIYFLGPYIFVSVIIYFLSLWPGWLARESYRVLDSRAAATVAAWRTGQADWPESYHRGNKNISPQRQKHIIYIYIYICTKIYKIYIDKKYIIIYIM